MTYNLLDEKWIPVLYNTGKTDRVGIRTTLAHAHHIREIAASNPMDRLAILRFLLALLYWCRGNPREELQKESFPPDWFTKLTDHQDCFNLLGDGKRFYQYERDCGDKELPANYLIQEVPTGTNFWHFRHSTDGSSGLCSACCAFGLLRLPLFATSGGRGKPPGVNSKPPIYIVPLGSSLADTLRLSWSNVPDLPSRLGTPTWEKPDLQLPKSGNVDLLLGLTWLPRRVWLDNPEEPKADCISCGRRELLIRRTVFAGLGSMKAGGDDNGRVWMDPHVMSDGKDVIKPSNALDASDAAAGGWARIAAGILNLSSDRRTGKLWIVGFATVQNDKYLEAMECQIPFTRTLEEKKVQESAERIERWQKEAWKLVPRAKPRDTSRKHLEVASTVAAVRADVEARVSAKAGELISGEDDSWDQAAREYNPMMNAIAKSLSPGHTVAALQRRRQIAGLKPDMQPKAKTRGKRRSKEGDDK